MGRSDGEKVDWDERSDSKKDKSKGFDHFQDCQGDFYNWLSGEAETESLRSGSGSGRGSCSRFAITRDGDDNIIASNVDSVLDLPNEKWLIRLLRGQLLFW